MRSTVFVLISFASAAYSQFIAGTNASSTVTEKLNELVNTLLQGCEGNLNASLRQELENSVEHFETCINNFATTVFGNDCKKSSEELISCVKRIANLWKTCLDPKEIFLHDFIDNLESQMLNTLCDSDFIAHLIILGMSCKRSFKEVFEGTLNTCINKLTIFQNFRKNDFFLNKTIICSDLDTWGICLIVFYQSNCEVTEENFYFMQQLYKEYQSHCNFGNFAKTNVPSFALLPAWLPFLNLFNFIFTRSLT